MEFRTAVLTKPQLEQEISGIIRFLLSNGKHDLNVSFGWGCYLDDDELYQAKSLPLLDLSAFIARSIESDLFSLGEGDFFIESQDGEIRFVLCHESDIHMTAKNRELAQQVASGWESRGYAPYEIVPEPSVN